MALKITRAAEQYGFGAANEDWSWFLQASSGFILAVELKLDGGEVLRFSSAKTPAKYDWGAQYYARILSYKSSAQYSRLNFGPQKFNSATIKLDRASNHEWPNVETWTGVVNVYTFQENWPRAKWQPRFTNAVIKNVSVTHRQITIDLISRLTILTNVSPQLAAITGRDAGEQLPLALGKPKNVTLPRTGMSTKIAKPTAIGKNTIKMPASFAAVAAPNAILEIISGPGVTQKRTVIKRSGNTITVNSDWPTQNGGENKFRKPTRASSVKIEYDFVHSFYPAAASVNGYRSDNAAKTASRHSPAAGWAKFRTLPAGDVQATVINSGENRVGGLIKKLLLWKNPVAQFSAIQTSGTELTVLGNIESYYTPTGLVGAGCSIVIDENVHHGKIASVNNQTIKLKTPIPVSSNAVLVQINKETNTITGLAPSDLDESSFKWLDTAKFPDSQSGEKIPEISAIAAGNTLFDVIEQLIKPLGVQLFERRGGQISVRQSIHDQSRTAFIAADSVVKKTTTINLKPVSKIRVKHDKNQTVTTGGPGDSAAAKKWYSRAWRTIEVVGKSHRGSDLKLEMPFNSATASRRFANELLSGNMRNLGIKSATTIITVTLRHPVDGYEIGDIVRVDPRFIDSEYLRYDEIKTVGKTLESLTDEPNSIWYLAAIVGLRDSLRGGSLDVAINQNTIVRL